MLRDQVIRVRGEVRWSIEETREGPYVAICDPLGLTVQSDTWAELMEDIGEVLDFMFRDLMRQGRLKQLLGQHGWTCQDRPYGERIAIGESPRFDIPFIPKLVRHDSWPQVGPA